MSEWLTNRNSIFNICFFNNSNNNKYNSKFNDNKVFHHLQVLTNFKLMSAVVQQKNHTIKKI